MSWSTAPVLLVAGVALPADTPAPPAARFWVADVSAGTLLRMDEGLRLLSVVKGLEAPRAVAVDRGGGAWVACGNPTLGCRIVHVPPRGTTRALPIPFGWVPDLAAGSGGGLWVADRGAGLLVRLDRRGRPVRRVPLPGVACVEVAGAFVLAGTDRGEIVRLEDPLGDPTRTAVGGQVVDVREGPAGDLWALDAASPGRLLRVGEDGGVKVEATLAFPAEHLAPAGEEVWVAATNAGLLRRYGPHGQLLLEVVLSVPGDPNFLESLPRDGSVVLPVGAAVVRVGLDGSTLAVATGFGALSGIGRIGG